jgi:hypothetical protein
MRQTNRNFIIFNQHRRLKRLWQFFFTGWGLVMVATLASGALFTRQLLWTPISAINMEEIASNQFRMSNAAFAGTDKNGEPFTLSAAAARQEYDNPDRIYVQQVRGTIVRVSNGKKIKDKIVADSGYYSRQNRNITLRGHVRVDSDNGDTVITDELVVQL